MAENKS